MLTQPFDLSIHQSADSNVQALKHSTVDSDADAREVARKFEAVLIQSMLKNMRSATPTGGLLDSDQANMYLEMFDQKIAEEISKSGKFGIQGSLYRELTGRSLPPSAHSNNALPNAGNPVALRAYRVPSASQLNAVDSSPFGFIKRLKIAASATAERLGTSIEAILAVAALETGWGKRIAVTKDGRSSHNLFGIKADIAWRGHSTEAQTHEYHQGELRSEKASFRVYKSEQQSMHDFADFLQKNPRYQNALDVAADSNSFIRELQRAGYATDPDYADKVISTMQSVREMIKTDEQNSTDKDN